MKLDLNDPRLLLLHKGNVTPQLIELIIEALEQSVTDMEAERKIKMKLTNVFIEAFQNVGNHSSKTPELPSADIVMVLSMDDFYKVTTQNLVEKSKSDELANKLEEINGYTPDELRDVYKKSLMEEEFSEKGTAGLGFIDIARKSGHKLLFKIHPFNDQLNYFTFEARIYKDPAKYTNSRRGNMKIASK
jgi:hypothetical protein